ncbi:MAG: molybdenum cofactor guanylyltransferase [Vicinamibacterales bacterium]
MTAAILAGGKARRLGGLDKTAIVVGGRSILERQIEALRPIAARLLLVGGRASSTLPAGLEVVTDLVPDRGPLGGLYTALTVARETVLVVAADLPFLDTSFLRYLTGLPSLGVDAVMPVTPDGLQPLCAVYLPSALDRVAAHLEAGRLELGGLAGDLRVLRVAPEVVSLFDPDGRMLLNVNTQADIARAEAIECKGRSNRH